MITARLEALEVAQNPPNPVNIDNLRRIQQHPIPPIRRQAVRAPQFQQGEDQFGDDENEFEEDYQRRLVCKPGTHEKFCSEEPSLDELSPKMVETTCLMEQVHVENKDKVVNLQPMNKEKQVSNKFSYDNELDFGGDSVLEFKGSNFLQNSSAYVNRLYEEEYVRCVIEDA
ncbi:hypothetical protein RND71_042326 [Anisodus tanguticus]|uniref:Uncharacterized protein n=1 Tax=Anisodus tanguticus TaxID=243964 RepID=A0AAE1UUP7_9SOLA|nr:hypothetical protein RND71_042326 [Anisodus tanguticus]